MSTNDATHTFPSSDDVAMYMAFEGVFGNILCGGVRGVVEDPEATVEALPGAA
jgi:hypothetical protein